MSTCLHCKQEKFCADEHPDICCECLDSIGGYAEYKRLYPDPVNPAHYQGDYVMRIIEDFKLDFLDGQVLKYILRGGRKAGEPVLQDHRKALWYLNRKIANLEKS